MTIELQILARTVDVVESRPATLVVEDTFGRPQKPLHVRVNILRGPLLRVLRPVLLGVLRPRLQDMFYMLKCALEVVNRGQSRLGGFPAYHLWPLAVAME